MKEPKRGMLFGPMARLQVQLLGGFAVRTDPGEACVVSSRKARALLAYLTLPAGRFHSRQKLTALLGGGSRESQAQPSFRQALAALRRTIGSAISEALVSEGDAMALAAASVTTDVADFEKAAADGSVSALELASGLYRGDLLDGLSVDEPPFEEWLLSERERLRELVLDVLARLLRERVRTNRAEAAIQTALRILSIDPLQEVAHRTLMQLFADQGRRSAALRQYQQCAGWLARELGTQPEQSTQELYQSILRQSAPAVARPAAATRLVIGQRSAPPPESPLIGRDAEIAALNTALGHALDSGARVAIVSGESGIGKSRLVQELAATPAAEGVRMLFGWCHATEQSLPFRPWIDALRGGEAALNPDLVRHLSANARAQLGRVFHELAGGGFPAGADEYGPLFEAMRELVESLAIDQPTMIVLEDLHWADAMSARLLAFLARRLARLPVLFVGTIRLEDAADLPVLQQALGELRTAGVMDDISLEGLSRAESVALARALQRRTLDHAVLDRIGDDVWKMSEGNPFVIVETLRALGDAGGHAGQKPRLPRSVRESVSQRLSRLPETAKRVLEAAAVVGRSFSFELLPGATGLDEPACASGVDELVRQRVLEAIDDRLAFSHDRIRQVAYEEILAHRRVLIHRTVAAALEHLHASHVDEVADELGHHFLRGNDARKAIPYLLRSAEIATERYALDDALGSLEQAATAVALLPAGERDRPTLDVALRRAFTLSLASRHREGLELLAGLERLQARVSDPLLSSEYFLRLSLAHAYLGEFAAGRTAGEEALREGERAAARESVGKALYALAACSFGCGAALEALAFDARAIPLLDSPRARYWLGLVYWNQAINKYRTGQFDAALASVASVEAVAKVTGDTKLLSLGAYVRAKVYAARGDTDAALECAKQAVELSRDPIALFSALRGLCECQVDAGDPRGAIETFERMAEHRGRLPAQYTYVGVLCGLGDACLAVGDVDRAEAAARESLDLNRDVNPFNSALAWRVLGRAALARGDADAARQGLDAALEAFQRCGATFEAERTRVDLARLLTTHT